MAIQKKITLVIDLDDNGAVKKLGNFNKTLNNIDDTLRKPRNIITPASAKASEAALARTRAAINKTTGDLSKLERVADSAIDLSKVGIGGAAAEKALETLTKRARRAGEEFAELNKIYGKGTESIRELGNTDKALADIIRGAGGLGDALKATTAESELLRVSIVKGGAAADELARAYGSSATGAGAINELNNQLDNAVTNTRTLTETTDALPRDLREGAKEGGKLGDVLSKVKNIGIGGIAAALGVGELSRRVVELSDKFTTLRSAVANATGGAGDLDALTAKVSSIGGTFGKTDEEILKAANSLKVLTGGDVGAALDLLNEGFLSGGRFVEDYTDQLTEYAVQAKAGGISAESFVAKVISAGQSGTFADKAIDTVKEFGLRIREQTDPTRDALEAAFGGNFTNELFDGLNDGTITTEDALKKVSDSLRDTELTATQTQTILADVFGGAGEDLGLEFITNGTLAAATLADVAIAGDENTDALRRQQVANESLAAAQIELVEAVAPLIANLRVLATEVGAGVLEFFNAYKTVLVPLVAAVTAYTVATKGLNAAQTIQAAVTNRATIAQKLFNIAAKANPIGLVAGAVALLVSGLVLLKNNIDNIVERFQTWSESVRDTTKDMPVIGRAVQLVTGYISFLLNTVQNSGAIFAGFRAGASQAFTNVKDAAQDMADRLEAAFLRVKLAATFDDEAEAAINAQIKTIEARRKAYAEGGRSVGEAFAEAYDAEIVKANERRAAADLAAASKRAKDTTTTTEDTDDTTKKKSLGITDKEPTAAANSVKTLTANVQELREELQRADTGDAGLVADITKKIETAEAQLNAARVALERARDGAGAVPDALPSRDTDAVTQSDKELAEAREGIAEDMRDMLDAVNKGIEKDAKDAAERAAKRVEGVADSIALVAEAGLDILEDLGESATEAERGRIAAIESLRDAELASVGDDAAARVAIEQNASAAILDARKDAAKQQKNIAISSAVFSEVSAAGGQIKEIANIEDAEERKKAIVNASFEFTKGIASSIAAAKKEQIAAELAAEIASIQAVADARIADNDAEAVREAERYDNLIREAEGDRGRQAILEQKKLKDLKKIEAQKLEIEKQKQAQIATANKEAAEKRKKTAQTENIILTALSVTNAFATTPFPFSIGTAAIALASGIAQGIAISKAEFADGGTVDALNDAPARARRRERVRRPMYRRGGLLRGPRHSRGGIPVEAEGGEAFLNRRTTSRFYGAASIMNEAGGGRRFPNAPAATPATVRLLDELEHSTRTGRVGRVATMDTLTFAEGGVVGGYIRRRGRAEEGGVVGGENTNTLTAGGGHVMVTLTPESLRRLADIQETNTDATVGALVTINDTLTDDARGEATF